MSEKVSYDRVAHPQPPRARGTSCWLIGCVSLFVLMVCLAIGIFFGARYLINKAVETYTSDSAQEIPAIEIPESEWEEIDARVQTFQQALESGTDSASLSLSDRDINALIANNPDFQELKDKIYVAIEDDRISGKISIPLDALGFDMLKGRYLNGEAEFKVSLKDGNLAVNMSEFQVNGQSPPKQMMDQLRRENLAKDAANDPEIEKEIRRIESFEIKDGKIHLKIKPDRPPDESGKEKPLKADSDD